MIYVFAITTPANTPQSQAQQTILPLSQGTITRVELQFPLGVNGLAHIGLNRGVHQLWPSNQSGNFSTGNETIGWTEDQELQFDPYQLEAYTFNDDPSYSHTITVRILMSTGSPSPDPGAAIQALNLAVGS